MCDKRRCIYVRTDDGYAAALGALQQKMESVSDRFYWGDLLFNDIHLLSNILVQKQDISCEFKIEIGYFNVSTRRLRLKDIYIHCGALGAPDFLYGTKEPRKMNKSDEFECRPICKGCFEKGKKPATKGKKDAVEERREKESAAKQKQSEKRQQRSK